MAFPSREQIERWYSSPAGYSETVDLSTTDATYTGKLPYAIFAATAGVVKFDGISEDGTNPTTDTVTLAAGALYPCFVTKIWKVGSTSTEIHVLRK